MSRKLVGLFYRVRGSVDEEEARIGAAALERIELPDMKRPEPNMRHRRNDP